jgi:large subunit ribosomal protein L35
MPKMKTNRGAAKRFKVSGTGKIRRRRAYLRHILTHKSRKQKRRLGKGTAVAAVDQKSIRALIPYLF